MFLVDPHGPGAQNRPGDLKHRRGIAHAERFQELKLPKQLVVDVLDADLAVNAHFRDEILRLQPAADNLPKGLPQFRNLPLIHGQAGCHLMAAKFHQQLIHGFQAFVKVEPGNAPGRALAHTVLQCDDHCRAVVLVDDSGSDNTDHARVPALIRHNNGRAFLPAVGFNHFHSLPEDFRFLFLPGPVFLIQDFRQRPGLPGIPA